MLMNDVVLHDVLTLNQVQCSSTQYTFGYQEFTFENCALPLSRFIEKAIKGRFRCTWGPVPGRR